MQALQRFQNSQFGDLEILTIEGKQWFPATEVAMTLGYSNPERCNKQTRKTTWGRESRRHRFTWKKTKQKVHR